MGGRFHDGDFNDDDDSERDFAYSSPGDSDSSSSDSLGFPALVLALDCVWFLTIRRGSATRLQPVFLFLSLFPLHTFSRILSSLVIAYSLGPVLSGLSSWSFTTMATSTTRAGGFRGWYLR